MEHHVRRSTGIMVRLLLVGVVTLLPRISFAVEARIAADAYTASGAPTANLGAKTSLLVQGTAARTYLKFDLSTLPASVAGRDIAKATLTL